MATWQTSGHTHRPHTHRPHAQATRTGRHRPHTHRPPTRTGHHRPHTHRPPQATRQGWPYYRRDSTGGTNASCRVGPPSEALPEAGASATQATDAASGRPPARGGPTIDGAPVRPQRSGMGVYSRATPCRWPAGRDVWPVRVACGGLCVTCGLCVGGLCVWPVAACDVAGLLPGRNVTYSPISFFSACSKAL